LVVKRNAGIITTSAFRHHLGLGARTAGKISIAPNWSQTGASSEIVIRKGLKGRVIIFGRTMTAVRGGTIVAGTRTRTEGRCTRVTTVGRDDAFIVMGSGLPVNGLETLIKLLGTTELPFAEDSPEDCDSTNT
jgi:hypothetical protein